MEKAYLNNLLFVLWFSISAVLKNGRGFWVFNVNVTPLSKILATGLIGSTF